MSPILSGLTLRKVKSVLPDIRADLLYAGVDNLANNIDWYDLGNGQPTAIVKDSASSH